jgi:ribosomal protein S12 methylthiotransferase accessory factor
MENEMVVTFPGNKRVDAEYKGYTVKTDQPVYQDGDGSAPAPFDLFMASLGTCAGHYLLSFCRSRGIDTEGMYVTLNSEFDTEKKRIVKVTIEAHLPPGFPERYQKAAVKAMETCTVKKYIESPFAFETRSTKTG